MPTETLYTKAIEAVTFDDIKRFCDSKIREGLRVDYKKDFPQELEKTISAFANTNGGIILVGVDADKATNTPIAIPGVDLTVGLEERVVSICHSNTAPPLTPEVKACPIPNTSTKCVLLVRVAESSPVPHFIGKKRNQVYVRIDNESEQADLETIKSLIQRRDQGVEKGKLLVDSNSIQAHNLTIPNGTYLTQIVVSPLCVTRDLIEFTSETDEFLRKHPSILQFGDEKPKRRGIEWTFSAASSYYHAEVTSEGLTLYREAYSSDGGRLYFCRVIAVIAATIQYAIGIYRKFGFFGQLTVRLELGSVQGTTLYSPKHPFMVGSYMCDDQTVIVERIVTVDELGGDSQIRTLSRMFLELARNYKWSLKNTEAEQIVKTCLES
jgi:hypothetical protein